MRCNVGSADEGLNESTSSGGGVFVGQGCGTVSPEGFTEGRGVETFFPRPVPGLCGLVGSWEGDVLVKPLLVDGIKKGRRLGRSSDSFGVLAFFPRPGPGWLG